MHGCVCSNHKSQFVRKLTFHLAHKLKQSTTVACWAVDVSDVPYLCVDMLQNWTALHIAIKGGYTECVKILLDHGVETSANTPEVSECSQLVSTAGNSSTIDLPHTQVSCICDVSQMLLLLQGGKLLHLACHHSPMVANLLLDRGVIDVDAINKWDIEVADNKIAFMSSFAQAMAVLPYLDVLICGLFTG